MASELTKTENDPEADRATRGDAKEPSDLGFIVLHCPEAPGFVGAWFVAGSVGDDRLLGRGAARPTDRLPRLAAVYQRPGGNQALGPLPCPRMSREQLELARSGDGLALRNVGSASLFLNGAEAKECRAVKGDIVEIGSSLMLLCTERPRSIAPVGGGGLHDFGGPDASGMVGESPLVWGLRRELRQTARHTGHLLVRGPTGAGKELVVRAFSAQACPEGPVVERNAATLPESLIDAELFGNLKNYPNAGSPERKGLVGEADGGMLFLDELAELPPTAQTHLLRVLDSGQYQRLGESTMRTSKFRLVGATNRPLSSLREDLLARFTLRLEVPPLAAHPEDVPLILRHLTAAVLADDAELSTRFLDPSGQPRFARELLRRLVKSPLPGNARELLHVLLSSLIKSKGDQLDWVEPDAEADDEHEDDLTPLNDAPAHSEDAARMQRMLDANNGSIEKTWRALGLPSRFALLRRIKKHKLVVRRRAE